MLNETCPTHPIRAAVFLAVLLASQPASSQLPTFTADAKPASEATLAANANVGTPAMWADRTDFADADRGLLYRPPTLEIPGPQGSAWSLTQYQTFIFPDSTQPGPDTINPSLYRNAQLNMKYGLYKVTNPDNHNSTGFDIYQVRGYDLSNITFVKGNTGWIVFDPLISKETAAAALALINSQLGPRLVKAVVYSHSHVDHYGGVRGLASDAALKSMPIIAPEGFTEHAISENVIAGNAMSRRSIYMYGSLLPRNPKGGVNGGLGQTNSTGTGTLAIPNDLVTSANLNRTVDGVTMVFQLTPGTEAPAEMNTYFPQMGALWMAENTTNTMHNVLTLRGAQVRDPLKWAGFLNETIRLFAKGAVVKFQSHHWPIWTSSGNPNRIVDYLKKQRDLYKYIHDQSVNLMNKGYTGEEISEMIQLPPSLDEFWPDRGYYGTLRHNSRAVYQRYMGWYSGHPSDLNNLPPVQAGQRYVQYMGGEAKVLEMAYATFANAKNDKDAYRWVAEVLKHVVFANPGNRQARLLMADALEQMGYQAESGPWRNEYLVGAAELRNPPSGEGGMATAGVDTIRAMPPEMTFDYWAVRINAALAKNRILKLNVEISDIEAENGTTYTGSYGLIVENSVLNHGGPLTEAGVTKASMTKTTFDRLNTGELSLDSALSQNLITVVGSPQDLKDLMALLETFPFWFNIIEP